MNKQLLVGALLCISGHAVAQTAAVPPAKKAAGADAAAALDVTGTVLGFKETSIEALAVTSAALGDRTATRVLGETANQYGRLGNGVAAIDTAVAAARGDMDRVRENAAGFVGDQVVSRACGMTGAPLHCSVAYEAGKLVGEGINYLPKLANPNNRTINEAWTDEVVFPTWTALGCPGSQSVFGVDPRYCGGENSQAARDAARQRHETSSRNLQSLQQEHDAQMQAQQSQQTASGSSGDSGFADGLAAVLGAYVDYEEQRLTSSPEPSAAPSTAPSQPATSGGCHPGHDEQAHPGGCLDYSNSQ